MKIGFVGLGSTGAPVAKNLVAAAFDVTVFDLDAARVAALRDVGARAASTPQGLAASVDVMMTGRDFATDLPRHDGGTTVSRNDYCFEKPAGRGVLGRTRSFDRP